MRDKFALFLIQLFGIENVLFSYSRYFNLKPLCYSEAKKQWYKKPPKCTKLLVGPERAAYPHD